MSLGNSIIFVNYLLKYATDPISWDFKEDNVLMGDVVHMKLYAL